MIAVCCKQLKRLFPKYLKSKPVFAGFLCNIAAVDMDLRHLETSVSVDVRIT